MFVVPRDPDTRVGTEDPRLPMIRRSPLAPPYYLGRPAQVWIDALRKKGRSTAIGPPQEERPAA